MQNIHEKWKTSLFCSIFSLSSFLKAHLQPFLILLGWGTEVYICYFDLLFFKLKMRNSRILLLPYIRIVTSKFQELY